MPVDAKIIRRLRALARVARENSGALLPERESAALEVVRLLVDNHATVDGHPILEEDEPKRKKTPRAEGGGPTRPAHRPPAPAYRVQPEETYPQFTPPYRLIFDVTCRHCGDTIPAGNLVCRRIDDPLNPLYFVHPEPCG